MAKVEEVEITLTREDNDDPYCTVWVGPPGTGTGVVCGKFPGTIYNNDELRRKIDMLAIEIHTAHKRKMADDHDEPASALIDDGKWRTDKPS